MEKYFLKALLLLVIFSSLTSTLSFGTALKDEDYYFEAIKRSNSAANWINLANYYSETNQPEKVVKVTQKIATDFTGDIFAIADIHNKAVDSLKGAGIAQVGGKHLNYLTAPQKAVPVEETHAAVERRPLEITTFAPYGSDQFITVDLEVKDPSNKIIQCTAFNKDGNSLGKGIKLADVNILTLLIHTPEHMTNHVVSVRCAMGQYQTSRLRINTNPDGWPPPL